MGSDIIDFNMKIVSKAFWIMCWSMISDYSLKKYQSRLQKHVPDWQSITERNADPVWLSKMKADMSYFIICFEDCKILKLLLKHDNIMLIIYLKVLWINIDRKATGKDTISALIYRYISYQFLLLVTSL